MDDIKYPRIYQSTTWTWTEALTRKVKKPDFVVDGLIPQRGVTLITGEGGIGKSFILLELAWAVSTGKPFLGHFPCRKGPVVVIDLENDEATITRRIHKIHAAHAADSINTPPPHIEEGQGGEVNSEILDPKSKMEAARAAALYEMQHPKTEPSDVHFVKKSEMAVASMYLNESNGRYIFQKLMNNHLPYLVLIDPLTALHSTDENDNVAMRKVIMLLQDVARQLDGAVVVVHHPRKRGMINDPGQLIRGASDLRNAVDSHIFLRRIKKTQIAVEHDKSRHASEVDRFRMEITDDPTGTATHIRYIGSPKEGSTKLDRAKESILAILQEQQTLKLNDILEELQSCSIPGTTARRALRELAAEDKIIKRERGLYSAPEES